MGIKVNTSYHARASAVRYGSLKQRHVHRLTDESCTIDMVARLLSFPDHDRPTISAVHSSLDPRRSKKKIGEQLLSPRPRLVSISGPETPPTCTRCACGGLAKCRGPGLGMRQSPIFFRAPGNEVIFGGVSSSFPDPPRKAERGPGTGTTSMM